MGVPFGVIEYIGTSFVMPIRGVAPEAPDGVRNGVAIGLGVWISFLFGVTPEKSEGCRSGFSPPNSGV